MGTESRLTVLLLWFCILHAVAVSNIPYGAMSILSWIVHFLRSRDNNCDFSAAISKNSVGKKANYYPTAPPTPVCTTTINSFQSRPLHSTGTHSALGKTVWELAKQYHVIRMCQQKGFQQLLLRRTYISHTTIQDPFIEMKWTVLKCIIQGGKQHSQFRQLKLGKYELGVCYKQPANKPTPWL
jgi:hypothetical protein